MLNMIELTKECSEGTLCGFISMAELEGCIVEVAAILDHPQGCMRFPDAHKSVGTGLWAAQPIPDADASIF